VVREKIRALPGVKDIHTTFTLREVKTAKRAAGPEMSGAAARGQCVMQGRSRTSAAHAGAARRR
jgi:hypothetical protein